jgi:hypothetical protein
VSTLDPRHVRPNMGNPVTPGIWFPLGHERPESLDLMSRGRRTMTQDVAAAMAGRE